MITSLNGCRKDYTALTTRMPPQVLTDLKHRLAPLYGGTLIGMYDLLVRTFFREGPWLHGLKWREEKIEGVGTTVATEWIQVDMRLEPGLAERVKSVAAANGVSPSTVLYTAVYYWIWYKNPTPEILKIRKTRRKQWEDRNPGNDPDAECEVVTPRRPTGQGPSPVSGAQSAED